jgi:hypothetical protein
MLVGRYDRRIRRTLRNGTCPDLPPFDQSMPSVPSMNSCDAPRSDGLYAYVTAWMELRSPVIAGLRAMRPWNRLQP